VNGTRNAYDDTNSSCALYVDKVYRVSVPLSVEGVCLLLTPIEHLRNLFIVSSPIEHPFHLLTKPINLQPEVVSTRYASTIIYK